MPERQRADPRRAAGAWAVAARDQHARLAHALFRRGDVDDALARILETKKGNAGSGAVALERLGHVAHFLLGQGGEIAAASWHVVIRHGKGTLRRTHLEPALAQHLECRRRAVLHQVAVDIKQALPVFAVKDAVAAPDFFELGQRLVMDFRVHHAITPAWRPTVLRCRRSA